MSEKKEQGISLPVEWHIPDDIPLRYATNLVIQRLENEFLISFFEIRPPIILGSPEEVVEKVKEFKSIRANCVAQIIVAADKMPDIVKALQTNLEKTRDQSDDKGIQE